MSNRTRITQIFFKLFLLQIVNKQTFTNAALFSNSQLEKKVKDQKETVTKMEELIKKIEEIIEKKQSNEANLENKKENDPKDAKKIVKQIIEENQEIKLEQFSINFLMKIIEVLKQQIVKMKVSMILLILTTKSKD
ncbi:hypothetical protein [Alphaproteobacteria bacterium endosymbiont of Tiliacea citrago]|uniref:hypothetical protein n=1 Tax=Alphaproteobacteria bacterium endosymbiont of Tiliacea citrago TaxID=3077944 RepID=UPI00313C9DA4